jgi:hypothetical protein
MERAERCFSRRILPDLGALPPRMLNAQTFMVHAARAASVTPCKPHDLQGFDSVLVWGLRYDDHQEVWDLPDC